jgi:hypothetical protein
MSFYSDPKFLTPNSLTNSRRTRLLLPYAKAPPPSHQLELRDGVVHLWLIDVTSPGDDQLAALKQWLMPEEIERNECYAQSVSRRRDVVCRG